MSARQPLSIWAAFDRAARKAAGATLRKGSRGGGRDLDAIVRHVFEADGAYLGKLGERVKTDSMSELRAAFLDAVGHRAAGIAPPPNPRRTSAL